MSTEHTLDHVTSSPARAEPGSDAMFRAIVQTSVNPFVVLDTVGHVRWCSEKVETLIGRTSEDVIGRHFLDLIDPSSHEAVLAEYAEFTSDD
ncbi:MAG TPA: PAS domain-containing protein, partial [Acidimicrobiales bacterium]|nr:PAS domain-containing protein [Acidimicrobiales bacterium]